MSSLLSHLFRLLIARVGLLLVSGDKRDAEILALRHQILVLQRQIDRPKFTPAGRTVLAVLSRAFDRRRLNDVMLIVAPTTVIGWHRRFVIRDGVGQCTRSFDGVFAAIGVDVITIPPGAPRANAFAERWVRTVRHELLDRTLIWNQRQLRQLLDNFIEHYNANRPHRSLSQRAPNDHADKSTIEPATPIRRTTTCAGLINKYRPAA